MKGHWIHPPFAARRSHSRLPSRLRPVRGGDSPRTAPTALSPSRVSCDIEHRDLEIATHAPLRALQYVGDHVFVGYLVEGPTGVLHAALRQLRVQAPAHPVNITIEPGLDVISADTLDRFDVVGRHPRGTQGTSLRAGRIGQEAWTSEDVLAPPRPYGVRSARDRRSAA